MPIYRKVDLILRLAMLSLLTAGLTSCCLMGVCLQKQQSTQVILQDSAAIRILPGDCQKSPAAKGWLLSDNATAKLLEAAETCKK